MESSTVPPLEIGSLRALSPEDSQFIGSSSGVYFVNTVYRAFAKSNRSKLPQTEDPSPYPPSQGPDQASVDNCIVGSETSGIQTHDEPLTANSGDRGFLDSSVLSYGPALEGYKLGRPPNQDLAKELIKTYFESWHPLFPFLFGKAFLLDVESFYADGALLSNTFGISDQHRRVCRAVSFQCIFNIAALDRADLHLPPECYIESSSAVLSMIGTLASKHDLPTLQALLALQLYLIATMSLQAASIVGGVLLRTLFHAGLHRCPFRYSQFSQHDCEIRKRIFWSAYVVDRYLSQSLGLPIGIQDSDIDVCIPGTEELHRPVGRSAHLRAADEAEEEVRAHLPLGHPDLVSTPSDRYQRSLSMTSTARADIGERVVDSRSTAYSTHLRPGEDVFKSYISYCRINGQALELFHKSIHNRAVNGSNRLMLNSEINGWWNGLPYGLQDLADAGTKDAEGSFAVFFSIIYQQLILLVNRPFLSRDPMAPEFRSSMQTCINSSRLIIQALKDPKKGKRLFSWPGILSSIWMSGLVLSFACQLDLYPFAKGSNEIELCLGLLQSMGETWSTARHCHGVLNVLLNDLRTQFSDKCRTDDRTSDSSRNSQQRPSHSRQNFMNVSDTIDCGPSKRQKTGYEPEYYRYHGDGSGTISPSRQMPPNPFRSPVHSQLQPHNFQMQPMPSKPISSVPGISDTTFNENLSHSANYNEGETEIDEFQWLNGPMARGIYPETGDLLVQLTWESLFQGNGNAGEPLGWDAVNTGGH